MQKVTVLNKICHITSTFGLMVFFLLFYFTPAQALENPISTGVSDVYNATVNGETSPIPGQIPKLNTNIPGLQFGELQKEKGVGTEEFLILPFIGDFIVAIYRYLIVAAAIISILMIILAGLQWTTSGGSSDSIKSAQKKIFGAITGMILAILSYTLLFTINPNLVQFGNLRVPIVKEDPLKLDINSSADVGHELLASYSLSMPETVNGVFSPGLTIPAASSCANVCFKKGRCADQVVRDAAYEIQQKTGYPGATLIAQYLLEGATFGIKCKGGFVPSEKNDSKAIANLACNTAPNCSPGYTWECIATTRLQSKYSLLKPVAGRDLKNGSPIPCNKPPKELAWRTSGYACFTVPPTGGNVLLPLLNFYEKRKGDCFRKARDNYGGNPKAFAAQVQACGYATGQNYAATLANIMDKFCLIGPAVESVPTPAVPEDELEVKAEVNE